MMDTMLDLFFAFIFVAGAAELAVIATLGTTFTTAGDARRPSASGSGKLAVAAGRRWRGEVGSARWTGTTLS